MSRSALSSGGVEHISTIIVRVMTELAEQATTGPFDPRAPRRIDALREDQ